MKLRKESILIILLFLFGCYQSKKKTNSKIIYYPNGKIKEEFQVKNDSIKNGNYKDYFENGELKTSARYRDNKLTDSVFIYYPNGKLKNFARFSDGVQNGETLSFYQNGRIEYFDVLNGGNIRSSINYSEKGRLIYYKLYDHLNNLGLLLKYENNSKYNLTGKIITSVFSSSDYDSLVSGNRLDLNIIIARIPNSINLIRLFDGFKNKTIFYNEKDINLFSELKYSTVPKEIGSNLIIIDLEIKDTIQDRIFNEVDTLIFRTISLR